MRNFFCKRLRGQIRLCAAPRMLRLAQCTNDDEVAMILALNRANHRSVLSDDEKRDAGFLTLLYTESMVRDLQRYMPTVIVKDGDVVAGYAHALPPSEGSKINPHLQAMADQVNPIVLDGRPLSDYRYYLMAGICVHADYRGKGVFQMLYDGHRQFYGGRHEMLITDISVSNARSMRAHERTGFRTIHKYRDQQDEWQVVMWDWRKR